jgi:dTDP-L-rhamnose 4-epimerase
LQRCRKEELFGRSSSFLQTKNKIHEGRRVARLFEDYFIRSINRMSSGRNILITGGAGFIGSHLADELLKHGYNVRALDMLSAQVHGIASNRPEYLNSEVELIRADLRDPAAVEQALRGIDAVYHLAAAVGVGQSMYEIANYVNTNGVGTAVLLEALIKLRIEKLIVASSMSIYGEGLYRSRNGKLKNPIERSLERLKAGLWDFTDEEGHPLEPVATPENASPCLSSIYALSKYDQERMCLLVGRAYKIPTLALRFFNVYGPRQALSNPYTGVLAIFASRLLNDNPPMIFEDGEQKRDFVSVYDVAQACRLALEAPDGAGRILNIGSGRAFTVREIAERMAEVLGKENIEPQISGRYRVGDVRHCFADISAARSILGYQPKVTLEPGLSDLAEWLEGQLADDHVESASAELAVRGLTL